MEVARYFRVLHEEIMRDLTSWQFGAISPFAWRALFRGPLSTLSPIDDDFFLFPSSPLSFSPGYEAVESAKTTVEVVDLMAIVIIVLAVVDSSSSP